MLIDSIFHLMHSIANGLNRRHSYLNHMFCEFFILLVIATVSVSSFQFGPFKATTRHFSHIGKQMLTLRGGDGVDLQGQETLIKFYTLKGGMCPYAARTWITLLELGLPFETIEISREDKDDWYDIMAP